MEKIYGTTRVIFMFSHLVVKLPNRKDFTKNLVVNFQEFLFYLFYRSVFCMPTYFSFFGLFNIQKRGERIENGYLNEEVRYLIKNILDVEIRKYLKENDLSFLEHSRLSHAVESIDNLLWHENYLKIIDYGDMSTIRFIKRHIKNLVLISPN